MACGALNALPVSRTPSVCRRVVCEIGGHAEARKAIETAGVEVLVGRTNAGVLAYGPDADVRAAFTAHGITEFDLHTIEIKRLRYDSGERGLLREALTQAIKLHRGLEVVRRRSTEFWVHGDVSGVNERGSSCQGAEAHHGPCPWNVMLAWPMGRDGPCRIGIVKNELE